MVEMKQLPVTPHSTASDSTSNHLEHQMENDVIIDLKAIIEHSKDGVRSSTCCISRVPQEIRDLKEGAYTPRVISIGPFHYGNVRLQEMESYKSILFERFTQETKTSLDDLAHFAKHSEPTVRASYSENVKLCEKELVKVILVDAGFIIELFRKIYGKSQVDDDPKLLHAWLVDAIRKDLLLLENQLPFSFLEELYNKAFPPDIRGDIPSFVELTYDFFRYFNKQELEPDPNANIKHFTDLLRIFHLQKEKPSRHSLLEEEKPSRHSLLEKARTSHLLYNATELKEAGVKFKASASKCLLDLKFIGHTLEVPQILVEDLTEIVFRNMIALEVCHYPFDPYIADYAHVLDCLINSNKDVDVLIHREIIRNLNLADTEDVAKVFNGLNKYVVLEDFNSNYLDICKRLNGFYQDPWHRKKATLRRDYCKTPWQTVATVAGIVLLILSLVQTIFSVLQVVLKRN